jgi:hypothetical protein
LLTAGRMTDGGVMHQLGRSQLAGRLPSLVHNSESGIRVGVRGNGGNYFSAPVRIALKQPARN